jgi:hypothetical protein
MASGYEKLPDYEGNEPRPVVWLIGTIIVIAIITGSIYFWPA